MNEPTSLLAQIADRTPDLSRTFRVIGDSVLEDPDAFAEKTLRELSETLGVSEPSIIRFGREFGYKGLPELRLGIARAVGSQNAAQNPQVEPALAEKARKSRKEKRAIARAALPLLGEAQAILLDSGSTAQAFAQELGAAQPLTIMTTGVGTLLSLLDFPQHKLMLPGGNVRRDAVALTGRMVEDVLASMSFDIAFIGADSIDLDFGLATYSEDEAHLTRVILKAARRSVLLADHSKFGAPHLHRICGLDEIDAILSDSGLHEDHRLRLENTGVDIHIAAT